MGVAGYALWLLRRYPNCFEPIETDTTTSTAAAAAAAASNNDASSNNQNAGGGGGGKKFFTKKPCNAFFDNLYLDTNGLIHPCCHDTAPLPEPESEEEMFERIYTQIDKYVQLVKPRKLLFIAVDGVAPRSKMNQQRARRFRAATEREENAEIAREMAEAVKIAHNDLPIPPTKERWDHNVITPSTPFMERVGQILEFYVLKRLNSDDPLWKDLTVVLSDAHVPGEGEHKVMHYIRSLRNVDEYDARTSHCIVGMDADLIVLGLATHELNFYVLRNDLDPKTKQPMNDQHIVLNLRKLRRRLQGDFSDISYGIFERIVDDFVFLCFFIGNDFLPHMPLVEIKQQGIETMLTHYVCHFGSGNYLTDGGEINYDRLRRFLTSFIDEQYHHLLELREQKKFQMERAKANMELRIDNMNKDMMAHLSELNEDDQESREKVGAAVFHSYVATAKEQRRFVGGLTPLPFEYGEGDYRVEYYVSKFGWPRPIGEQPPSDFNNNIKKSDNSNKDAASASTSASKNKKKNKNKKNNNNNDDDGDGNDGDNNNNNNTDSTRQLPRFVPHSEKKQEGEEETEEQQEQEQEDDDDEEEAKTEEEKCRDSWRGFEERVANVCREYLRGMQWVMRYYTVGCPSYEWFYPYHHAPLLDDVATYCHSVNVEMNMGEPLHPIHQLLAVLPQESVNALPPELHDHVVDPKSVLAKFYPKHIEVDFTEATFSYQGVIKLPFLNVEKLKQKCSAIFKAEPDDGCSLLFCRENSRIQKTLNKVLHSGKSKNISRMKTIPHHVANYSPIAGKFGNFEFMWDLHERLECQDRGFAETEAGSAIEENKVVVYKYEMIMNCDYKPELLVEDDNRYPVIGGGGGNENNNDNNNQRNRNYNNNDNNNQNQNYQQQQQRNQNYQQQRNYNNDNYDNSNRYDRQQQQQYQQPERMSGRRHGRYES